jgi:predicted TIM-barrel fold metal-dependent hydrolase
MIDGYPVTDIHVHVQPWQQVNEGALRVMYKSHENPEHVKKIIEKPERFLAVMDREGIDRAGLINYVSPDVIGFDETANDFSSEFARDHRDRLIPFGSVHPKFCEDPEAEMERLISTLEIAAIKIHPPHQLFYPNEYRSGLAGLETIYTYAEDHGVPVMIHGGTSIFPRARIAYGDPIHVDDVAVDFPRLKIILAHGGRPLWMDTAFFLVRGRPNVYLELSSIPPKRLLEWFPKLESVAHKTLWGSDWPGPGPKSMEDNVRQFLELPLSDEAKRRILHGTAAELFPP